jgi:hypothetical protein
MTSRDIKANDTLLIPKKATGKRKPDAEPCGIARKSLERTRVHVCFVLLDFKKGREHDEKSSGKRHAFRWPRRCGLSLPDCERLNEDRCSNLHP